MNAAKLSKSIGKKLREKGLTLSVAESCTGGLIGHLLTQTPGSSDYFLGGVVAYSNPVKEKQLKVAQSILKQHGAVSAQTAAAMSKGALKIFKSDVAVAVTGIAGPDGGTKAKPVGLVWIGLADKRDLMTFKKIFRGSRTQIKNRAAQWTLKKLDEFI